PVPFAVTGEPYRLPTVLQSLCWDYAFFARRRMVLAVTARIPPNKITLAGSGTIVKSKSPLSELVPVVVTTSSSINEYGELTIAPPVGVPLKLLVLKAWLVMRFVLANSPFAADQYVLKVKVFLAAFSVPPALVSPYEGCNIKLMSLNWICSVPAPLETIL